MRYGSWIGRDGGWTWKCMSTSLLVVCLEQLHVFLEQLNVLFDSSSHTNQHIPMLIDWQLQCYSLVSFFCRIMACPVCYFAFTVGFCIIWWFWMQQKAVIFEVYFLTLKLCKINRGKLFLSNPIFIDTLLLIWLHKAATLSGMPSDVHRLI